MGGDGMVGGRLAMAAASAVPHSNSYCCRAKKGEDGDGVLAARTCSSSAGSGRAAERGDEVWGLVDGVGGEDEGGGGSHPRLPRGAPRRRPLRHGEDHQPPPPPMLDELEHLLKGIAMMQELTLQTSDYLVSFGECMPTRIFAAYLNNIGTKAQQYDAFDIGFVTTDDFTNAGILEATYPAVAKRLHGDWIRVQAIPVVTGFLGKGWKSGAVTTLGQGGSDLTATTIGKALGFKEIQVHAKSE